jgi:hypothetical protein
LIRMTFLAAAFCTALAPGAAFAQAYPLVGILHSVGGTIPANTLRQIAVAPAVGHLVVMSACSYSGNTTVASGNFGTFSSASGSRRTRPTSA